MEVGLERCQLGDELKEGAALEVRGTGSGRGGRGGNMAVAMWIDVGQ